MRIPEIEILEGDCLEKLKEIPDGSVQCCVTSPPYWGLRDYGVNEQLGLEETPEEYVGKLVEVFREVKRVLREDGTCWVNLGDSYAMNSMRGKDSEFRGCVDQSESGIVNCKKSIPFGLKPKDLVGIPWRVAFALQADGWWLRQDIIWAKPNPMPESVTDRCTKAHEFLFLFAKSQRYYFDNDAIREPYSEYSLSRYDTPMMGTAPNGRQPGGDAERRIREKGLRDPNPMGRNKRDVWTVTTEPFKEAHFATFPPDLIKPCILAGSRTAGKRCDCNELILTPTGEGEIDDPSLTTGRAGMNRPRRADEGRRPVTKREQREWAAQLKASPHREQMEAEAGEEAFAHYLRTDDSGARPPRPDRLEAWLARGWLKPASPCDCPIQEADTILDPFAGSGTTGMVALELGRKAILIELNPKYVKLIQERTNVTAGML